jgi:expansin (peptidoglycan-binding protein)
VRRRWLVTSVAAAFLFAAGLLASLVLLLLPDPETTASHAAVLPVSDGRLSARDAAGTPTAGPVTASGGTPPSPGAHPTTPATGGTASAYSAAAVPAKGPALLAGRIKPGTTYRGFATFYGADGGGSCLFGSSGDLMVAAMNHTDYEGSKACGAYVLVRAANGASVTVRITDRCPECSVGQLSLSEQAFAQLAAPSAGRVNITWKLLSPNVPDPISIRYRTGSSRQWCAIQVINHRNPLTKLELRSGGAWRRLSRSDDNYFLSPGGTGCGGSIRVTDIYGQQLILSRLPVKPDVLQATKAQFAGH